MLLRLLGQPARGAPILDVGCGTGNYTRFLADVGLGMVGVDPSAVMLGQARTVAPGVRWVRASGEALPLADGAFQGAISTLATHHFGDSLAVFTEIRRVVARGNLVLLLAFPEQVRGYWLRHYFPTAVNLAANQTPRDEIREQLRRAGFGDVTVEPWRVPPDLKDLFWYAGKDRPELYFDPEVRAGISAFRLLCPPEELASGLAALRADIDTGRWASIRAAVDDAAGDYAFVTARC